MSSNFNNSTPAAPAGSLNIKWQTDGAGNDSAYYGVPFVPGVGNKGAGQNNDIYFYGVLPFAVAFPSGASGSTATAKTAATGSTTFTFKKNGSSFATVVFSGSGTVGAFTLSSTTSFNGTSDILEIDGPATADATLADFTLLLLGYRT